MLRQMQFLEPFADPAWELNPGTVWIKDLPVEIVRQGYAHDQPVVFKARFRQVDTESAVDLFPCPRTQRT